MFEALVQIREEANENKLKKTFKLSNWLHNVPLQISNKNKNSKEILSLMILAAKHEGFLKWVEEVSTRHDDIKEWLAENDDISNI